MHLNTLFLLCKICTFIRFFRLLEFQYREINCSTIVHTSFFITICSDLEIQLAVFIHYGKQLVKGKWEHAVHKLYCMTVFVFSLVSSLSRFYVVVVRFMHFSLARRITWHRKELKIRVKIALLKLKSAVIYGLILSVILDCPECNSRLCIQFSLWY